MVAIIAGDKGAPREKPFFTTGINPSSPLPAMGSMWFRSFW